MLRKIINLVFMCLCVCVLIWSRQFVYLIWKKFLVLSRLWSRMARAIRHFFFVFCSVDFAILAYCT